MEPKIIKINGDDPIFFETFTSKGLTKREYFAALAMQGLLANNTMLNADGKIIITKMQIADIAVISADALIEQLNKEKL